MLRRRLRQLLISLRFLRHVKMFYMLSRRYAAYVDIADTLYACLRAALRHVLMARI